MASPTDDDQRNEAINLAYAAACLERFLIFDPVAFRWWCTVRDALHIPAADADGQKEGAA